MNRSLVRLFIALVTTAFLTWTLLRVPTPGVWWHVVRWAFYVPIVLVGGSYGSFAGLLAGLTASLVCAIEAASRDSSQASWLSTLSPDFVVVGLLAGFLKILPHFGRRNGRDEPNVWPSLSRVSEPDITLDPNPLESIESAARLLGEIDTPPELREELVGIVSKECKHLSANITLLLEQRRDVSPPESHQADLPPILDAAIREAEFFFSGLGIVFRKEIAPDVPPIECSPEQIRNLFMSLIVHAAESATPVSEVILDAHRGYNGVVLAVKVRGSFLRRFANRFFGSRPVTAGNGLATARDIVRQHGGRIGGKANLKKGLEFSVWLPLHRNDPHGGWQGANSRGR